MMFIYGRPYMICSYMISMLAYDDHIWFVRIWFAAYDIWFAAYDFIRPPYMIWSHMIWKLTYDDHIWFVRIWFVTNDFVRIWFVTYDHMHETIYDLNIWSYARSVYDHISYLTCLWVSVIIQPLFAWVLRYRWRSILFSWYWTKH